LSPPKALPEENRARLAKIFLKLFKDQEIAQFMVAKVFPPVEKIEIGKEQKGRCKFKILCDRRYVGKIGKIEQGGCDAALGAILSAGPLLEGVIDFSHRKLSLDCKNGLHAKQGIFGLMIKEIKIDQKRQVDIRPYSLIFPVCTQPYQTIKNTLNLIHWK
jgi:hypothetical protein